MTKGANGSCGGSCGGCGIDEPWAGDGAAAGVLRNSCDTISTKKHGSWGEGGGGGEKELKIRATLGGGGGGDEKEAKIIAIFGEDEKARRRWVSTFTRGTTVQYTQSCTRGTTTRHLAPPSTRKQSGVPPTLHPASGNILGACRHRLEGVQPPHVPQTHGYLTPASVRRRRNYNYQK